MRALTGSFLQSPTILHRKMKTQAPDFVTVEHLDYLDALRESGIVNMFGARPYLMQEFPELTKQQAATVLSHWMQTFPTGLDTD